MSTLRLMWNAEVFSMVRQTWRNRNGLGRVAYAGIQELPRRSLEFGCVYFEIGLQE